MSFTKGVVLAAGTTLRGGMTVVLDVNLLAGAGVSAAAVKIVLLIAYLPHMRQFQTPAVSTVMVMLSASAPATENLPGVVPFMDADTE